MQFEAIGIMLGVVGGLILAFGFLIFWFGKSKTKKAKIRGQKRKIMTNGEYLINRFRVWKQQIKRG
jgi:glycopeptide antibiotics resistance protein